MKPPRGGRQQTMIKIRAMRAFETAKFWLNRATGTIEIHMPVMSSIVIEMASDVNVAAAPSHNIGSRPTRSEARPTRVAPTRVRAERREVWPPWQRASHPSASRRAWATTLGGTR
eukprot:scaffold4433_cov35-Tisochrysis_lutea.AAC.3